MLTTPGVAGSPRACTVVQIHIRNFTGSCLFALLYTVLLIILSNNGNCRQVSTNAIAGVTKISGAGVKRLRRLGMA